MSHDIIWLWSNSLEMLFFLWIERVELMIVQKVSLNK